MSLLDFFLPINTFTERQCDKLQVLIYDALLPKLGYNRHIPLTVRYGPIHLGGVGLINAFTEQMVKHIQFLVGTIRQSSELSLSITISLSLFQLNVGSNQLFLNLKKTKYSHVTGDSRILFSEM